MKLGLGLHSHQLDLDHYRFARQCGCTHLAVHLDSEWDSSAPRLQEVAPAAGYAVRPRGEERGDPWSYDSLSRLTEQINAADLQVFAVKTTSLFVPPDHLRTSREIKSWLAHLKVNIRNAGESHFPPDYFPPSSQSPDERLQ